MGGKGSGRPPSVNTLIKREYDNSTPTDANVFGDFHVPNLSGVKDIQNKIRVDGYTDGSVLFAGSEKIQQDNSNLCWDNTNKKLGIGTTNPEARVHVVSSAYGSSGQTPYVASDFVIDSAATAYFEFLAEPGEANQHGIIWSDGETARGRVGYNHSTNKMVLSTSAITRMAIDSTGNVGIATDNPTSKLHVVGDGKIDVSADNTNALVIRNSSDENVFEFYVDAQGDSWLNMKNASGETGVRARGDIRDIQLGNRSSQPSIALSGSIFVSGGALFYLGSGGTLTQVASA